MKKFQHIVIKETFSTVSNIKEEFLIEDFLNQYGGKGWELVQMIPNPHTGFASTKATITFIFKKEVSQYGDA